MPPGSTGGWVRCGTPSIAVRHPHAVPVDRRGLGQAIREPHAQGVAEANPNRRPRHLAVVGPDPQLAAAVEQRQLGRRGHDVELVDGAVGARGRRVGAGELAQEALLGRAAAGARPQGDGDHGEDGEGKRNGAFHRGDYAMAPRRLPSITIAGMATSSLKHNLYFDGQVQSVGFERHGRRATVGVIAPGEYHFGTDAPERMTVVSGELAVRTRRRHLAPYPAGTSFEVRASSGFDVRAANPAAYLCEFL